MKNITLLAFSLSCAICTASWSTFHGDNHRRGYTPQVLSANPVRQWTANMLGKVIVSPIVASDGTIYVGPVLTKEKQPRVLMNAVNPNGTIKWRFECKFADNQVLGCPALDSAGNVYFGTGSGMFYSLSPAGELRWSFDVGTPVSTAVLAGSDGNIYAKLGLELYSFTSSGAVRWHRFAGDPNTYTVSETLSGLILLSTEVGLAAYTSAGDRIWTAPVGSIGAPVVDFAGRIVMQNSDFRWIDPATGGFTQFSDGPTLFGTHMTVAVDPGNRLYFPMNKYSATGVNTISNNFFVPNSNSLAQTWSSPVIDGAGKVFMGAGISSRTDLDYEKNLFVLSNNLNVLNAIPMGHVSGTSSPAIGSTGEIYMASLDGLLYCFK